MNAIALSISNIQVRQDSEGRYCLNDLHKAAGGEKRHIPSYWLSIQQTKEIITELETTGIPVVSIEGRKGGTFVVKELVYAYATWISAKFFLQVIRAYDALVTAQQSNNPLQLPEPKTKQALPGGLTLEQQDTIKALVKQRAEEMPKEKQAGATVKLWSAVKKKFGVPYKEIEPDNFINVISLIGRLPLQGEYIAKDEPETKALSLTDVEKLIAERLKNTTAPLPVTGQVFINTRIAFDADHLNDLLKSQSLKITRI